MIYRVINFALCLQSRGGIDNFCLFQITSFESCQVMFHLLFFEATKISYYFQAKTVQLIFLFLVINEKWKMEWTGHESHDSKDNCVHIFTKTDHPRDQLWNIGGTIMPVVYSVANFIMDGQLSLQLVEHTKPLLNYWITLKKMPNGFSVSITQYLVHHMQHPISNQRIINFFARNLWFVLIYSKLIFVLESKCKYV